MFAKVTKSEDQVKISFSIWDKFLNASRKDLTVPLAQIVSIDSGPDLVKQCRGMRAPGTYGFGVIAGTYRQRHGVRHFWNVRKKLANHTIRFNLSGNKFKSIVIQVEDPEQTINSIGL